MRALPTAISAAALLAGCSDPKTPNEANFTKAITPLIADRFCMELSLPLMTTAPESVNTTPPPFPLLVSEKQDDRSQSSDREQRAILEQATKDGYLTRRNVERPARDSHMLVALRPTALIAYEPTDKGKAYFRPVNRKTYGYGMRPFPNLCFGRGKVDAIVRWTDPADMFGRTVTQVTYRYSATDIIPIVPAEISMKAKQPQEATTTLVKASDGWQPM